MKYCTRFVLTAALAIFALGRTQAEDKPIVERSLSKPIVDRFDTNGNGKIDPEEAAAARDLVGKRRSEKGRGQAGAGKVREALLKKFDANGNGKLDPEEREIAMAAIDKRRAAAGNVNGKAATGKGGRCKGAGNGRGVNEGKGKAASGLRGGARREALLMKFDTDGNGKLDPDERESAKVALQNRRANKISEK